MILMYRLKHTHAQVLSQGHVPRREERAHGDAFQRRPSSCSSLLASGEGVQLCRRPRASGAERHREAQPGTCLPRRGRGRGLRRPGGQTLSGAGSGRVPGLRWGTQDPGGRNSRFKRTRKRRGRKTSQTRNARPPPPRWQFVALRWPLRGKPGDLHSARVLSSYLLSKLFNPLCL